MVYKHFDYNDDAAAFVECQGTNNCTLDFCMRIDANSSGTYLQALAVHEMGHALRLGHVADVNNALKNESRDGTIGAIMGCGPGNSGLEIGLRQDDYAQLWGRKFGYFTANGSFEDGLAFWKQQGSATVLLASGAWGPKWVRIQPWSAGGEAFLYSETRVTNIGDFTARMFYKKESQSNHTGQMKLVVRSRGIDYSSGSSCSFPNGWDLTNPSHYSTGFVTRVSKSVSPGTTWQPTYTSEFTHTVDGVDLRVYGYSYVMYSSTGDPMPVGIDFLLAYDS
jgi:hypothetical protein